MSVETVSRSLSELKHRGVNAKALQQPLAHRAGIAGPGRGAADREKSVLAEKGFESAHVGEIGLWGGVGVADVELPVVVVVQIERQVGFLAGADEPG